MPKPLKRRELVRRLRELGFDGPFSGSKHQFMVRGALKLRIPNPHAKDIGPGLLQEVLRQAGIDPKSWDGLKT